MVYILLGTGFEEIEAITPVDLLRRAGIPVETVGINGRTIRGSHGIPVEADITLAEIDREKAEMIVLPGGMVGVASIQASEEALNVVRYAYESGRYVAAICAGPTILADLGITDGKEATCYPGCEPKMGKAELVHGAASVTDGKVITGTSAGCSIPFARALIEALRGLDAAEKVANQIVIR